jgi:multidrug transporter EmrE-like cation transporter
MTKFAAYILVSLTVLLAIYGQLAIKWRMSRPFTWPDTTAEKLRTCLSLACNFWIISAVAAIFFAGVAWILAMTRLELSAVYPFVAIVFIGVLLGSCLLFGEPLTVPKIFGNLLIAAGIILCARG